jgi:hypothetical protein
MGGTYIYSTYVYWFVVFLTSKLPLRPDQLVGGGAWSWLFLTPSFCSGQINQYEGGDGSCAGPERSDFFENSQILKLKTGVDRLDESCHNRRLECRHCCSRARGNR